MFGRSAAALMALALCATTSSAFAGSYSFTFDNGQISGSLFTSATSNADQQISGISGTAFGETITGLIGVGGFNSNDNTLYPLRNSQSQGYLDINGLSFTTASGKQNIYSSGQYFDFDASTSGGSRTISGDFTLAPEVSAAPESGAWALMMLGIAGLGAALRFRRCQTGQVTTA